MKFFHVSDVNLGFLPDGAKPWSQKRREDISNTFEKVLEQCEAEQVDALFLTGNLFSHVPTEDELRQLDQQFLKLTKTKVFLLAGEKEAFHLDSVYESFHWESATTVFSGAHFERVLIEDWDCCITGISFDGLVWDSLRWDTLRRGMAGKMNILLLPKLPAESQSFLGKLQSLGFDYIGYGGRGNKNIPENQVLCAPGTLEPLNYKQTRIHGYISGQLEQNFEGQLEKQVEFVECASCEYIMLQINVAENMKPGKLKEQLSQVIASYGKNNIYRIVLKGTCSPELFFAMDSLREAGNILEIIDQTTPQYTKESILASGSNDVVARFVKKMAEKEDSEENRRAMEYGINALMLCKTEEE